MVESAAPVLDLIRDEFKQLSRQLRKEVKNELRELFNPGSALQNLRKLMREELNTDGISEGPARHPVINREGTSKQVVFAELPDSLGDGSLWESARPLRSAKHEDRITRLTQKVDSGPESNSTSAIPFRISKSLPFRISATAGFTSQKSGKTSMTSTPSMTSMPSTQSMRADKSSDSIAEVGSCGSGAPHASWAESSTHALSSALRGTADESQVDKHRPLCVAEGTADTACTVPMALAEDRILQAEESSAEYGKGAARPELPGQPVDSTRHEQKGAYGYQPENEQKGASSSIGDTHTTAHYGLDGSHVLNHMPHPDFPDITGDHSIMTGPSSKRKVVSNSQRVNQGDKALGLFNRGQSPSLMIPRDERSAWQHKAIKLATSSRFELFTLGVIIVNAIMIGATTDHMARQRLEEDPAFVQFTDLFFGVFFTIEVCVRLFAWRSRFFHMWGWAWNMFDLTIVLTQILELILELIRGGSSSGGYGIGQSELRVLRAIRTVRVVRVLRVMRVAEDLQLLVSCVLHSFSSFFWALVLLFLMVYIASIYLTQMALTARLDGKLLASEHKIFLDLYGTLPTAVLSLTQGLLGGLDWRELVDPIEDHISPFVAFIFVMFILFLILAVLNVITGNFVQTSLEGAMEIKDVKRLNQARSMFLALDYDHSGEITYDEISQHLEDPAVQEFFASMDIDVSEAHSLFYLIDTDNSGVIDFEEFLRGSVRLQGAARATDLLLVTRDFRAAFDKHGLALQTLERHLCHIRNSLNMSGEATATLQCGSHPSTSASRRLGSPSQLEPLSPPVKTRPQVQRASTHH